MIQRMTLGPCPYDEECAQVGTYGYQQLANKECRVYIRQLWRMLKQQRDIVKGNAPDSFDLIVWVSPHELGLYAEAYVRFDDEDQRASQLAYWLENNLPANWDDEALKELES